MVAEIAPGILTPNFIAGAVVSIVGGAVAASNTFARERKVIPPTFDWVDFILLWLSGAFSGFIGFLFASWQLEVLYVILAIAGLSAIGGYDMLIALKDMALDAVRGRLIHGTQGSGKHRGPYQNESQGQDRNDAITTTEQDDGQQGN